jgi:16S rRNA (adenine1518-N6/adenine1519-N6)-dimethyltransferase
VYDEKKQLATEVKKALRRSGLKPKKSLGQHFLIDHSVLETIIHSAELTSSDNVIEVGPGLGVVTLELARKVKNVIAVEIDSELALSLKKKCDSIDNISVINADILKMSPDQLIKNKEHYKVVANLPYYITSPVLQHFIRASLKPSLMVVMVQKEVGQSIVAAPGQLNILAISLQLFTVPEIVDNVPSDSFYPEPKVDSVIVRFSMLPKPVVNITDTEDFLHFVRCGFSAPRKQLRNSLSKGLQKKPSDISPVLEEARIEPQRRPETLSIKEWEKLYIITRSTMKEEIPC